MSNVRTKPWVIDDSLQDKKSQTQDVHVHVGSCDDNTLTYIMEGGPLQHLVLIVKGRRNLILH